MIIDPCSCGGARGQFGIRGDASRLGFKCVQCSTVTSEVQRGIRGCSEPGVAVCVECSRGLCAKHWSNRGSNRPLCELDRKRLRNVVKVRPSAEPWWA